MCVVNIIIVAAAERKTFFRNYYFCLKRSDFSDQHRWTGLGGGRREADKRSAVVDNNEIHVKRGGGYTRHAACEIY